MTTARLLIDGDTLSLEEILRRGARCESPVELAPEAAARVRARPRAGGPRRRRRRRRPTASTPASAPWPRCASTRRTFATLQRNLILSHAAGVGDAAPDARGPRAPAAALQRAREGLLRASGPRRCSSRWTCSTAASSRSSPSAAAWAPPEISAPLAHLALVLIGEGEAFFEGERMPGAAALARAGLEPVVLEAKEGLALVNGTQAMCAVGALALLRAEALARARRRRRRDDAGGAARAATSPSSREIHGGAPAPGPDGVRRAPARAPRAARELVETHVELRQGAGPLLAALHAPGARRGARRPVLRAAHARHRGEQRHRQPAGLRRRRSASSPAATSTGSRSRWRWTCWPWRCTQLVVHQRAPRGAAGEPVALRAAALPREELRPQLRLHDRPGDLRRPGRRVAGPLPPRLGGLHPLVRRPRGSRVAWA